MAEEAVKIDPDAIGHKAFHENAAKYGEAFSDSSFEPGVKATESERDYHGAKADVKSDVFEGRGYDESAAKGVDDKFETYMNDRAEMDAQMKALNGPDNAADGGPGDVDEMGEK